MKKKFAVFGLDQQRKIYSSDDTFYCLGDLFKIVDSKKEAKEYIKECAALPDNGILITILKIYTK